MTFQILPLDRADLGALFDLDDDGLAARGARRVVATHSPGFPCRVSLEDAEVGETLVLVNHAHLTGNTPFAASHAIYVRKGARPVRPAPGAVPMVLQRRLLSVRAFDRDSMMIDADVVDGAELAAHLEALLSRADVDFVHLHYARPGCFAAAVARA